MPGTGIAASHGSSILSFYQEPRHSFQVAAPIYTPTNSVRGFPFLYTLSSIYRPKIFDLFIFRLPWVFVAAWRLALATESGGYSLDAMHGLLFAVASLFKKHRL